MSIRSTIQATCDLSRPLTVTPLRHALVSGDNQGDVFEVAIRHNGEPADITGAGVVGYFIRQTDGSTVTITGTASGNKASVVLPEACYDMPGRFTLTIKVNQGGDRHAVYVAEGAVLLSSTDTMIDPGHVIPSLEELLAQVARIESTIQAAETATGQVTNAVQQAEEALSQAETATQEASDAAQAAEAAASGAEEAADKANEVAGQIEGAVASATEAAEAAGQATEAATEAAASATSSAEKADASAAKADGAAEAATTAASSASEAAERANGVISATEAAGESATSAAQTATQAAEAIDGLTVEAVDGETAGATVSDVDGHKHIAFTLRAGRDGKDGEKGDPGLPNIIKGQAYDSLEALQEGVPSPAEGDQYNVGTEPPYHVYRWTGSDWEDQGITQGPKGEDGKEGPAGKNGATFTPTVSPEGMLSWSNDQELPNPESVDIRGPKGDDGIPGINGENGEPGAPGKDGVTPHIDEESGNWFIGEEDTHVHAQGPKGEPGTTAGVPYSDEEPKPLGAATAGVSEEVSRADHVHKLPTADDIQAVPTTRTVNNHALSEDVVLTADDIQAVPAERTINAHPLSEDVTLTAKDVQAVPGYAEEDEQNAYAAFTIPSGDDKIINRLDLGYRKEEKSIFVHVIGKESLDKKHYLAQSVWGSEVGNDGNAKPEVGGTNLLYGTRLFANGVATPGSTYTPDGYEKFTVCTKPANEQTAVGHWQNYKKFLPGKYVFSAYVKAETDTELTFWPGLPGNTSNLTNTGLKIPVKAADGWKRVAVCFENKATQNLGARFDFGKESASTCAHKLEHGEVPTDWTPAPEDTDLASFNAGARGDPGERWYKFAYTHSNSSTYNEEIVFLIDDGGANTINPSILSAKYATDASFNVTSAKLQWIIKSGNLSTDDFVLAYKKDDSAYDISLWFKATGNWATLHITVLSQANPANDTKNWTFCRNFSVPGTSIPEDLTQVKSTILPIEGTVPTTRTINGQTLDKDITIDTANIEYSTVDLEAGVSELETGKVYLVYE